MIHDLDQTIRKMLIGGMPIKNGEINIEFDQPKRENSIKWLQKPTVNLFLYDLRENHVLRQHQWERQLDNVDNTAQLKRTPFRVDCFYMLSAWANHSDTEHRVLASAMLALFRCPTLPDDQLVGTLIDQPYPIQTRLASHDRLTNPAEVWSALDNELRPTISYVVTLAFDPWLASETFKPPLVLNRRMRTGQSSPLTPPRSLRDETQAEMNEIGGCVRRKHDGTPYQDCDVAIKGTGWIDKTDEHGRFRLGALPAGQHTLIVWHPGGRGRPKQRTIRVPADGDTYDIEF